MPGGVSAEKLGWGGAPSSRSAPQHGCFQGKWVLVEIPSHDLVRMTRCHSSPGNLLPGPHLHVRHGKGRRVQTSQRATCASLPHGWLGAELLRRWRGAPADKAMAVRHKLELALGSSCSQLVSRHCPPQETTLPGRRKLGKCFFLTIFHLLVLSAGFLSKRRFQRSRQSQEE